MTGGATGHAEVVRLTYDPAQISIAELLAVLGHIRPGGTAGIARPRGRTGTLGGPHWRTLVGVEAKDVDEARAAAPTSAEVGVLGAFVRAEARHQRYAEQHPDGHYTCTVIAPKLAAVRERFPHLLRAKF